MQSRPVAPRGPWQGSDDGEVDMADAVHLTTPGALAAAAGADQDTRVVDWSALADRGILRPDWDGADWDLDVLAALEPPLPRAWRADARPDQLAVADTSLEAMIRLILAGRGWGKSYTTTNALAEWQDEEPGDYAAIAPTLGDARKVLCEGPSGLLVALGDDVLEYNKSELIIYTRNGSRIVLASGERPDRIRGWNLRAAIIDELASFPGVLLRDLWDGALMPALRIGQRPKIAISTTPRRGNPILKELIERHDNGDSTVMIVRGKTRDNAANLSAAALDELERRYAGTTMGRQELDGELLADAEGALITTANIEAHRITDGAQLPPLNRVVVAVDPSVDATGAGDACGIVVVGIGGPPRSARIAEARVTGPHAYVLEDATMNGSPERWGRRTLEVAAEWAADAIVGETNQGGDLVATMIRMVAAAQGLPLPRFKAVTASVGKRTRAEPVAGLAEQGRMHFVNGDAGAWRDLEDAWTGWTPGDPGSPNELDACTWGVVDLFPELAVKARPPVRLLA